MEKGKGFIADKILGVAEKFSPGGIASAIGKETVGKVFDKGVEIFNKVHEGKMDVKEAEAEFKTRVLEIQAEADQRAHELDLAYIKDVQGARDKDIAIQRSKNASWLAKNLPYILDGLIICSVISMIFLIVFHLVPESNKEIFYSSFGALLAMAGQVISYHRGANKDSEETNAALRDDVRAVRGIKIE